MFCPGQLPPFALAGKRHCTQGTQYVYLSRKETTENTITKCRVFWLLRQFAKKFLVFLLWHIRLADLLTNHLDDKFVLCGVNKKFWFVKKTQRGWIYSPYSPIPCYNIPVSHRTGYVLKTPLNVNQICWYFFIFFFCKLNNV